MALNPLGPVAGQFYLDNSEVACIMGPVGCLPAETEYLSPSGWRRMDEYVGGEVAQWRDGVLEFVTPLEYFTGPETSMVRFKSAHALSMVMTENHRMPLHDYLDRFVVRAAGDVFKKPSTYRVPTTFLRHDGLGYSDLEVRVRVMIAADGHYPRRGNQCVLTVRKERKKSRCRALLSAAGISFIERVSAGRPTETRFTFARPAFDKPLGPEWFSASTAELAILLDEIQHWDGLCQHEESRFATTKRMEADIVQFAAHANGLRATISRHEYPSQDWAVGYTVFVSRGAKASVRIGSTTQRERVAPAKQFCFSVPSTFFLVRHEGCVFVTGNSAKTTSAALRVARHIYEQTPGPWGVARSRWAIVRNTGPQLQDTTIKSWLKLFPENVYGKFEATKKIQRWRFQPKGMNKMIDAEIMFRALDDEDDVANLLSLELTGAWFNELREISPTITAHMGRRVGRYPGADLGGCTWRGWFGDTNPWPFTSEFHDMFVTNLRRGYSFFKQPGGMDPGAENLENLEQTPETLRLAFNDPQRIEQGRTYYINALRDYSPEEADMYVHCKYGASRAGKPVYVSYNDNVHCKEFEFDKRLPIYIGYDSSGRNPAAVVAQKTPTGQWRIGYEFCETNMGMVQHAKELRRFVRSDLSGIEVARITLDPAVQKDASDLNQPAIVRSEFPGVQVLQARTNDISTRIEAVDKKFREMVAGEPALIIHPRCKILRAACINEYHFRRLKVSGRERFTEEPDKVHPYSDVADALQYLMLGGGEARFVEPTQRDPMVVGRVVQPGGGWSPFELNL